MFSFLLKIGFMFIAPENVALLHSQKSECANTSDRRALEPKPRRKPKRDTVSSFKLVSQKVQKI